MEWPFVSCIMPTYNRRAFVPHAIRYFLQQDYPQKELIIIDDGSDSVEDLVPPHPFIRYHRLPQKISLGAKLNMACGYAKGDIVANWDDDDWYAPRRLTYQVDALQNKDAYVCGINKLLYYDLNVRKAYQYIYPSNQRMWLLGSSLCYKKEFWQKNNFADINIGMDGLFVWSTTPDHVKALSDPTFSVHMIHNTNVSPKKTDGGWWHVYPVEEIEKILNGDWHVYTNGSTIAHSDRAAIKLQSADKIAHDRTVKNIYACLVHENEECIIDLVRNLHYHDPSSLILLYNGGENTDLLKHNFPYDKFGASVHPNPEPVKWGYLHKFALKCMHYALEHFSFDTLTIVDSDQLCIRNGYSKYLGEFLHNNPDIGMLSSEPKRIAKDNNTNPVALQAYKEYDLWKPLLQSFPEGEEKFVHWTFWPSTVFTAQAIRDLVKLFDENKMLQEIMERTRIWATEEVIFPTLVRLLGYKIALNPCSYDFVRYKVIHGLKDIQHAVSKRDAYWIHPVLRRYDDPIRKYARNYFHHYIQEKDDSKVEEQIHSLQPAVWLKTIESVEGWLDIKEADFLVGAAIKACSSAVADHSLVEIGSYHGKATILLGNVVKAFFPNVKVIAIDPHDGKQGALDQGLITVKPSLEKLKENIRRAGLSEYVEIIKDHAYRVPWAKPISFLVIDGLHDYPSVASDFWHFSEWLVPGGYVAFHDYADYYPGVKGLVNELIYSGSFKRIKLVQSLILLQKKCNAQTRGDN